jgi:hypothetical protein
VVDEVVEKFPARFQAILYETIYTRIQKAGESVKYSE